MFNSCSLLLALPGLGAVSAQDSLTASRKIVSH